MRRTFAGILAVALAGCGGEPRLDATTDATVKASITQMSKRMDQTQAREFLRATTRLTMGKSLGEAMRKAKANPNDSTADIYKPLHGLTASEIIAKAKTLP